MTWNDITVEQYQTVTQLMREQLDELELSSRLVGVIYDKTQQDIDEMPLHDFNHYCKQVTDLLNSEIPGKASRYITANKRLYFVNYFIEKITFAQYAEVKTFSEDWVMNSHKVMASICTHFKVFGKSKRTHAERANDFLHAKFCDVYHCALFFYQVYLNSMIGIEGYMVKEMSKTMNPEQAEAVYSSLIKDLAGFTTLKSSVN
jgi:hypothetical protein